MELPKNITQIGESDKGCKIYIEDYVISYIKQLNRLAYNKDMAVALYGRRRLEGDITYIFIYGACKLDFLQREARHLSQAQHQEIEKKRRKHFPEYDFQGYRLLNGEMVEGYHICEQDICRYVSGYAQFYEKNDVMLAYMLEAREIIAGPEVVNQEKYEQVKIRQEERREEIKRVDTPGGMESGLRKMKLSTAAVFVMLCLAALSVLWSSESGQGMKQTVGQAFAGLTEQKLPDAEAVLSANAEVSTLVAEDNLANVVKEENDNVVVDEPIVGQAVAIESAQSIVPEVVQTMVPTVLPEPTNEPVVTTAPAPTASPEPTSPPVIMVSYTIQQGDTLIGISIARYGNEARVREICELNGILEPDDIKIGQEILLPKD